MIPTFDKIHLKFKLNNNNYTHEELKEVAQKYGLIEIKKAERRQRKEVMIAQRKKKKEEVKKFTEK